MSNAHAVTARWEGGFEEARLSGWAQALRARLSAPKVTLGLVYLSPALFPHAAQILEVLRVHAQIPLLAGCSSTSLIRDAEEWEDANGLVLGLYHLPGAELRACRFTQEQVEEANGPVYWHMETSVAPEQTNGWIAFADPFHLDCESWLNQWNEAYAPLPILGGLATGAPSEQTTQVYLNGDVFEDGGVAISIGGDVELLSVISQGCTPIGQTWTITNVERNIIHQIGNRPAYQVLVETFEALTAAEKARARRNLFVGLVVNEYLEDFHRGDFLVRNLIGADAESGKLAVGALPRTGQTLQFQRRDATAATEDMEALLQRALKQIDGRAVYGGSLHCCNGRGTGLFGMPNHDAGLIQQRLGPIALTGFFCNGEIGPIGDHNFLHGYTASLALFVAKRR